MHRMETHGIMAMPVVDDGRVSWASCTCTTSCAPGRSDARVWFFACAKSNEQWWSRLLHWARAALLASVLASVGAAACNDSSGTAPKTADDTVLPDSAESGVFGTEMMLTSNSIARGRLLSDSLFTYEGGNRLELRPVHVTFFDSLGAEDGVMTAKEGTVNNRLNRLEVRGDVVLLRENGTRSGNAKADLRLTAQPDFQRYYVCPEPAASPPALRHRVRV